MLRQIKSKNGSKDDGSGQTFLEYAVVLSLIAIVMFTMRPMIQRPIQMFIKLTADQIGVQTEGEQRFDETGHLVESEDIVRSYKDNLRDEFTGGFINGVFDELTQTERYVFINLGFTEDPDL